MTPRQLQALRYAVEKGGAWYMPGRRMGGAKARMIDRMVRDGLLSDVPPYPATDLGVKELAQGSR